jgi:outer membrane receptor protein involved in Fe transport
MCNLQFSRRSSGQAITLSVFGSVFLGVSAANAVTTSAPTLDEIVITAQKRAETLQDIPLSVYAISGADLEAQGITSVQGLANSVAGVTIASANPGNMYLNIRGTADLSGSYQGSSVNGFYIDEVAMSYVPGYMPDVGVFDLERVEVLRGPQGTLFGDGSLGGTLRVITKKPDSTSSFGRYKVGFESVEGGGAGFGVQSSINLPIQKDVLAASLSVSYRNPPGWIDVPDLHKNNSNDAKLGDYRLAVRYTPTAALTVDASYLYSRSTFYDFLATSPGVLNPAGVGPVGGLSPSAATVKVAALTVSYDAGFATFISASAATDAVNEATRDVSSALQVVFPPFFVPGASASALINVQSQALSQEFRLVSNGHNNLDWTVGTYALHEKRDIEDGYTFNIPAIQLVDVPLEHTKQTGTSWAAFADANYRLTEHISAQIGDRFFSDKKDFSLVQIRGSALPLGFAPAGTVQTGNESAKTSSPKLGLTYKISNDTLVFVKYAKGFRSGGSNTVSVSQYPYASSEYGPESLYSYEIGLKSKLSANWYLNSSVYHNEWSGLQLPFRTTDGVYTYTTNAGAASANGAELETGGHVGEHLNLSIAYAYIDSKIDRNVYDGLGHLIAKADNTIPFTSKNKLTLSSTYTQAVTDTLKSVSEVRYRWATSTYSEPSNMAMYENGTTSQLFVATGMSDSWGTVRLYVDNALNRTDSSVKLPPPGPNLYVLTSYLRPRTFGIEFSSNW